MSNRQKTKHMFSFCCSIYFVTGTAIYGIFAARVSATRRADFSSAYQNFSRFFCV